MKTLIVTLEDRNYFAEATDLMNRTQGRDLFAAGYLEYLSSNADARIFAALNGERLIGIGVAQIIDRFEYYLPFDSQIVKELSGQRVGSLSTMSVLEEFQGQGVGQKITAERLRWLKEQGCKTVLGNSWVSGLVHTSNRVFERMGFRPVKRVENFFLQSSTEKPFDCPGCQVAPCVCAAILYRLDW